MGSSPLPLLLFKLCRLNPKLIRQVFVVFGAFSWSTLAWAVSRSVSVRPVRVLGSALVLSLGLSIDVIQWNAAILSESLSVSCIALCAASGLMLFRRPVRWFIPVLISAAAVALCRDSNAYLILLVGLLLLGAAVLLRREPLAWRPLASVGFAFILCFLVSNASSNNGGRWQYPLTNVIVMRMLPNQTAVRQLEALGMPVGPVLRAHRRRGAYDSDPELAPFRNWLATDGKHSYLRYLASNPGYSLEAVEFSDLLGTELARYRPDGIAPGERSFLAFLWLRSTWLVRISLTALLSSAALVFLLRRERSAPIVLGLLLAVLVYPHGLVVWHGDSMEVARHGLPAALQLQLAFILLLVGISDALARRAWRRIDLARAAR